MQRVRRTPDAAAGCEQCIDAPGDVCDAVRGCARSVACQSLGQCLVSCQGRLDCRQACTSEYADAAPALGRLLAGVTGSCVGPCAIGSDFQCAGHVTTPYVSQTGTSAVSLQVLHPGGSSSEPLEALEGVDVSYCAASTQSCSAAVATDDAGAATLEVPLFPAVAGPRGYLTFASRAADAGGGASVVPTLYYWGFPLTETQVAFVLPPPDAGLDVPYALVELLAPTDLSFLVGSLDVTLDPNRGHIAVSVVDCIGVPAIGVTVTCTQCDDQTLAVYAQGSADAPSFVRNGATQTDASGAVIFVNVPAGDGGDGASVELVATIAGTTTTLATATVLVKPQQDTSVTMLPTQ